MKLKSTESALGLYSYSNPAPTARLYLDFYDLVVGQMRSLGLEPTYIAADGEGYSGKFVRAGGASHRKWMNAGLHGVSSLSLVANPPKSDAPSYDSFFYAALGYIEWMNETLLCITSNEAFLEFGSDRFHSTICECLGLFSWDFGFGFSDRVDRRPKFYILGADDGKLSSEEEKRLDAWYESAPKHRQSHLRNAYTYNILNEEQIRLKVPGYGSLGELAQSCPGSSLSKVTDRNLYIWTINRYTIESIRSLLVKASILIER